MIDAPYGHDCFLLEEARQTPMIQQFLARISAAPAGDRSMTERRRPEASRDFGFDTRQVHAGQRPDPNTGARAVPIFQTTSYVFEDPESAAAYFNLQEYGNTYSRIMNPTNAVFEERMASLEGGCGAVAFASGIAAQAAALFTLLQPGDHVVSSSALYGGTVNQFKHLLRKMTVELTWVDPDDPDAWKRRHPRRTRRRSTARRSATRPATSSTSRRWRPSRTSTSCRCSSTTPSRRRICAGRSSGAPTSCCTRRPSSSAATAPASAASSYISNSVSFTSCTDSRMLTGSIGAHVEADRRRQRLRNVGISSLMRSTTPTTFVPGCFWMDSEMFFLP